MIGQADDPHGVFPFGTVAGFSEPRRLANAQALVLGVYPSALHVRWTHPRYRVTALAVAPEPWPFWDGEDEADRVDEWRAQVGWQAAWGTAEPAGRVNGSSGQVVRDRVLSPLGLTLDSVWLTDALPYFHVHRGRGTQGAAMSGRYDPFAAEQELPTHDLPSRPSPAALIARARTDQADRLRQELHDSGRSAPHHTGQRGPGCRHRHHGRSLTGSALHQRLRHAAPDADCGRAVRRGPSSRAPRPAQRHLAFRARAMDAHGQRVLTRRQVLCLTDAVHRCRPDRPCPVRSWDLPTGGPVGTWTRLRASPAMSGVGVAVEDLPPVRTAAASRQADGRAAHRRYCASRTCMRPVS